MAEPQAQSQTEQARGKAGEAGAKTESRTFDDTRRGGPGEAVPAEGAGQAVIHARAAGRQLAEGLRQTFDPFIALQYDMSRWFDDMFRQTFGFRGAQTTSAFRPLAHFAPTSLFGLPPADLKETETAHLLSIELPGLTKDDIDISIDEDALVISGAKSETTEDASAAWRISERRFGRFERIFPLPLDVDRGRIEAQFKDGVLNVTLPKSASAARRTSKVEIRT